MLDSTWSNRTLTVKISKSQRCDHNTNGLSGNLSVSVADATIVKMGKTRPRSAIDKSPIKGSKSLTAFDLRFGLRQPESSHNDYFLLPDNHYFLFVENCLKQVHENCDVDCGKGTRAERHWLPASHLNISELLAVVDGNVRFRWTKTIRSKTTQTNK